jgi:hypothetical protein
MTIEDVARSNSLTEEHIARLKERARFVRTIEAVAREVMA